MYHKLYSCQADGSGCEEYAAQLPYNHPEARQQVVHPGYRNHGAIYFGQVSQNTIFGTAFTAFHTKADPVAHRTKKSTVFRFLNMIQQQEYTNTLNAKSPILSIPAPKSLLDLRSPLRLCLFPGPFFL